VFDYTVVSANNIMALRNEVNALHSQGYRLVGGVSLCTWVEKGSYDQQEVCTEYAQAMVYEKDEVP
jgi:hypothetical protein